ncbi:glycosyltransferase family A protein [Janthinobacterium sp. 17J80-10]|uniref:glycosyltransferase n=1 Tax=Janthinobacterium sp. 17J80-10 TaxID=2497863 RepID=UPI0010059BDA|nr:glycosyltransferase family A protein [Janthinobacterium sp. 17J80-10]QAU34038.1 glycosyltransferase [Janthinobacterium sp. 17J80-10]
MAKIIAFPGKSCCPRNTGKQKKIRAAQPANALLDRALNQPARAASIQPIWNSRKRSIVVSAVVPAHGNPGLLNRCLAALMRQTLPFCQYEIIVVDSAPSNASREVVENHLNQFGNKPCLIYLPVDTKTGAAAARNHGWQIARGAIVAFTEEDSIPDADWLKQGLRAFDGTKQAVRGTSLNTFSEVTKAHEGADKTRESAEFASFNCFCLRRVLEDLGGFDERFGNAGRDDADLYLRLLEADAAIGEAPLAVVQHPAEMTYWASSLQQQKNTQFEALLYRKHPRIKHKRIRRHMPWHYPAIVMALLCISGALILHNIFLFLLATATWTLLTAHLCLQRLRGAEKSAVNIFGIIGTSLLLPPIGVFWHVVGALRFRLVFL